MYHHCQAVGYCKTGFKWVCGLTVQDYPGKLTCAHINNPTVHPSIPDDLTLAAPAVMLRIKQALTRRVSCSVRVCALIIWALRSSYLHQSKMELSDSPQLLVGSSPATCTSAPSEAGSAPLGSPLTAVRRNRHTASTLSAVSIYAQRAACSRAGPEALPP